MCPVTGSEERSGRGLVALYPTDEGLVVDPGQLGELAGGGAAVGELLEELFPPSGGGAHPPARVGLDDLGL